MKYKKELWAQTPTKGHKTDAGYDLYSPIELMMGHCSVSPRIDLGIGFEIPEGYVGIISERSSQGKIGVHTIGNVVDFGYTGNVHVTLINTGMEPYKINKGDRICQLLLIKIGMEELEEVTEFSETERGDGAHGSTGR
jgi:dUTP pyrophosphatase